MTDPNDTPTLDLGCGDSGCVVARSGGMSTNGGCGCVPRVGRPMTPEVRAELRRTLTVRREQVDGLVARIATLEQAGYQQAGKSTIADPALIALAAEVRLIREHQTAATGTETGRSDVAGWVVAGRGSAAATRHGCV